MEGGRSLSELEVSDLSLWSDKVLRLEVILHYMYLHHHLITHRMISLQQIMVRSYSKNLKILRFFFQKKSILHEHFRHTHPTRIEA